MANFEEDKQSLIDLIIWYRDKYHKKDWCHSEIIEEIKKCNFPFELYKYEQRVDSWID